MDQEEEAVVNKGKKLIIVLVILALVIAVTLVFLPKLKAKNAPVPQNANNVNVYHFEQTDVDSITWRYDGEENTFRRTDAGYVITSGEDLGYDGTQVKYMVSAMVFLEATRVFEEHAELSAYGIDESSAPVAEVALKDGSVLKMWFGDDTTTDKSYMYMSNGDGKVYLISNFTREKFQYTLNDLLPQEEEDAAEAAA